MNTIEKWIVSGFAVFGLLMFFFPILRISAPIVGTQSQTGYDVVTNIRPFSDLGQREANNAEADSVETPISLRLAFLISIFVAIAFASALLCAVGVLWSAKLVRYSSVLGTICSLLAIVHVKIANSDLHRFLGEKLAEAGKEASDNIFSMLAGGIAKIFVGAMNMAPGTGLYVLTASLAVVVFLTQTRLLGRFRLEPGQLE